MTGTRASCCTRAIRLLPPRGTMTSMLPVKPVSMWPTAARSCVGTHCIQVGRQRRRRSNPSLKTGVDCGAGSRTLRTAPQDHRVAGLQAQRTGVGGHIRPAFINDADDAERHANALNEHSIGPGPLRQASADGIARRGDLLQPPRHALDSRGVKTQSIEQCAPICCVTRISRISASFAAKISASADARSAAAAARKAHEFF